MERALSLISTGTLTIAMVRAAKQRKKFTLPKVLNLSTGKGSTRRTEFSDKAWGKETRAFAKLARGLTKAKYDVILEGALEAARERLKGDFTTSASAVTGSADDDERACLVSDEDSDGGYVSIFISSSPHLTDVIPQNLSCCCVQCPYQPSSLINLILLTAGLYELIELGMLVSRPPPRALSSLKYTLIASVA